MKKKIKALVLVMLMLFGAILAVACTGKERNDKLGEAVSQAEEEKAKPEKEIEVKSYDSEVIVWKVSLPFGTGQNNEIIDLWQRGIDSWLAEKNKKYKVKVEAYGLRKGEEEVMYIQELKKMKDQKEHADIISIGSQRITEDLTYYVDNYLESEKEDIFFPLDDYIASEKGRKLQEAIPEHERKRAEVNGKKLALSVVLPATEAYAYSVEHLEKYGIKVEDVKANLFENEELFLKMKELGEEDMLMLPYFYLPDLAWQFSPSDQLALDKNGNFVAKITMPEVWEYIQKMYEWKEKGILRIGDTREKPLNVVQPFYPNYSLTPYFTSLKNGKTGEVKKVYVVPEDRGMIESVYWGDNRTGVASWSNNKENALDFLSCLFSDDELANRIQHGQEGIDYTLDEAGYVQKMDKGFVLNVFLSEFSLLYTNPLLTHSTENMGKDKKMYKQMYYERYEKDFPDGFRFDSAPVKEEVVATNKEFTNSVYGVGDEEMIDFFLMQATDWQATLKKVQNRIEKSGMEKIIKEAERQKADWEKRKKERK